MVEARDQVLIMRFSPVSFMRSMRPMSFTSTNGGFLLERATVLYYLPFPAAPDDVLVRRFLALRVL